MVVVKVITRMVSGGDGKVKEGFVLEWMRGRRGSCRERREIMGRTV